VHSILHLLNGAQFSGLERVVELLVSRAADFGYKIHLGMLLPDLLPSRMQSRGAIWHRLEMRNRLDLSVTTGAVAIVRESDCRVVHSHTVRSALIADRVKKVCGLPWIHHVHSPAVRESNKPVRNLANAVCEAAVLRRADLIVTVSVDLAGYVARYYRVPPSRIKVISNGVEQRSYRILPLSSPPTHRTIVAVGLFRPRKGIDVLINAMSLLVRRGHAVKLLLIGDFEDTSYRKRISSLVNSLQLERHVEFRGFRRAVESELAHCNVMALPSLYGEGCLW
jgi:glycosyltransferase involved in cell wall biosynthesis